jgi:hypothetical protein
VGRIGTGRAAVTAPGRSPGINDGRIPGGLTTGDAAAGRCSGAGTGAGVRADGGGVISAALAESDRAPGRVDSRGPKGSMEISP